MRYCIPLWLRDNRKLDAIDKYCYLCLIDILGEERLDECIKKNENGQLFHTIDFLIAYVGIEETALYKVLWSLTESGLISYGYRNFKMLEICIIPWGKYLNSERKKIEDSCSLYK